MNDKKVFGVLLLVLASALFCGVMSAATKQAPAPVQYTAAQKDCLKAAQNKRMTAIRPATEAMSAATKGAMEAKQAAIKAAQELKSPADKTAAIKAANDAYNNNPAVKASRAPYLAATKEANTKFQNDSKVCLNESGISAFFRSILKNIGASISGTSVSNSSPVKNQIAQKATNTPLPTPATIAVPKYTDAQKACLKTAQDKRMAAMKPATDELKAKTDSALKARQDAIAAAQKITDVKKRAAAVKAANDTYNNDPAVKDSKTPYMNTVKAANDQFQVDQKACLEGSGITPKGFFKNIGDGISTFFRGIRNFFTGKK